MRRWCKRHQRGLDRGDAPRQGQRPLLKSRSQVIRGAVVGVQLEEICAFKESSLPQEFFWS